MRIGIIDLGTNTFHLLIADVRADGSYEKIFVTRAVVKLGKGGIDKNIIAEGPFKKGIKVIAHFNDLIKEYKVKKVFAFATSAIRSSKNGKAFTREVKDRTGISVKVIKGEEEAALIYLGVRQGVDLGSKPVLIIDIGGGSTEFIIANNKKIFWKYSFNIGASRLLEQFKPSDPIKPSEVRALESYFEEVLKPLRAAVKKYPVSKLIGSSGSFDTLAEVIGFRFHGHDVLKGVTHYAFNIDEYRFIHKQVVKSTTEQRKKMKGMIRMRVDMIVVASICINYVLNALKIKEMEVSKYALKEGALWQVANT